MYFLKAMEGLLSPLLVLQTRITHFTETWEEVGGFQACELVSLIWKSFGGVTIPWSCGRQQAGGARRYYLSLPAALLGRWLTESTHTIQSQSTP